MDPSEEKAASSNAAAAASDKPKPKYAGPKPGVKYPLSVVYCGGILMRTRLKNLFIFIKILFI